MDTGIKPSERLIVALDSPDSGESWELVEKLDGIVTFFKVGIILHTSAGPDFVRRLLGRGKKVFLDLKFFDIKDTVREAVRQACLSGVHLLTVHANSEVMKGAAEARGGGPARILAVTLLTNLGGGDDVQAGSSRGAREIVLEKARLAAEAGCDGVISSGMEAAAIRKQEGRDFLIVTPGIRPGSASSDGHLRLSTPFDSIRSGADYLVVGRPVRNASDPAAAALAIIREIGNALDAPTSGNQTS